MRRHKWYAAFETRRVFYSQDENVTWIETDPDFDVEEVVPIFMRLDGSTTCIPRANFMQQRFGRLRRSDLESAHCSQDANILLDECTFADRPRFRTNNGPLTARELYERLKRPRFRMNPPPSPTETLEVGISDDEPDAERRIIYIADPDRWSVLSLIAAASSSQAGPLGNALYRHFVREAFLGMTTTTTGFPMFELAFHLPFRASRPSRDGEQPEDSRDVSFLDLEGRESAFMVRASYSCAVAGVDNWRWTAYCLIDTQHDEYSDNSDDRESADTHFSDIQSSGNPPVNPCGNGKFFDPGPEPRYFFLRTLQVRLTMVRDEWMQIVQQLEASIHQYKMVSFFCRCSLFKCGGVLLAAPICFVFYV